MVTCITLLTKMLPPPQFHAFTPSPAASSTAAPTVLSIVVCCIGGGKDGIYLWLLVKTFNLLLCFLPSTKHQHARTYLCIFVVFTKFKDFSEVVLLPYWRSRDLMRKKWCVWNETEWGLKRKSEFECIK